MEEFADQIKALSRRVQKLQSTAMTEEATKTSLIMPFFQALGYDVFNPEEFLPEFSADVGIKKGERVDYAIILNGKPLILVEAKSVTENLKNHDSQLYRYFGTTEAKFGILTNGVIYRFYTDLDEINKMDGRPFFELDMSDIRDSHITELAKFRKTSFDLDSILTSASELKYTGEVKHFFMEQMESPSEEFIKAVIKDVYPGMKTKNVLATFSNIVKKSFRQLINEQVNDKLKSALDTYNNSDSEVAATSIQDDPPTTTEEVNKPVPITTAEELEGYVLIRFLLKGTVNPERVYYRDNQSYFNVLLDDNIRKWICRLGLDSNKKYIQIHDKNRSTHQIQRVSDLENFKEQLIEVTKSFL